MSGWTEYVIANKKDAAAIAKSNNPKGKWKGFEGYKFFGPSHLAPLCELLGQAATFEDFPELAFGKTGWVYELPRIFTDGIREANDDRLNELAVAWSKRLTEHYETYTSDELAALLQQIRELLVKAKKARKPVLLWHSITA